MDILPCFSLSLSDGTLLSRSLCETKKRLPCRSKLASKPVGVTCRSGGSGSRKDSRRAGGTGLLVSEGEICGGLDRKHGGSQGMQKVASCLGIVCITAMMVWVEPAYSQYDNINGVQDVMKLGDISWGSLGFQKSDGKGLDPISGIFQKTKTAQQKVNEERAKVEKKRKAAKEDAARQKAAAEAKEKAEKEELLREKQARTKLEQQALLGGGAVGLSYALMSGNALTKVLGSAFRVIGGPNLVATLLKTPGYVIGRRIHLVEWDVSKSPGYPDGSARTITLKTHTLSGLRTAISKQYGLSDPKMVKQMSSWISFGPGFFEPLTDFNSLSDPGWVVWSRNLRKGETAIPTRANPTKKKTTNHQDIQWQVSTIIKLVRQVAAVSRNADENKAGYKSNLADSNYFDKDPRGLESNAGLENLLAENSLLNSSQIGPGPSVSASTNLDQEKSKEHSNVSKSESKIYYKGYDSDDVIERVLEGGIKDSNTPHDPGESLFTPLKTDLGRKFEEPDKKHKKIQEKQHQGSERTRDINLSSTDHQIPEFNKHNNKQSESAGDVDKDSHIHGAGQVLRLNLDASGDNIGNQSTSEKSLYHHPAYVNAVASEISTSGEASDLEVIELSREITVDNIPENFEAIYKEEENNLVLLAAEKNSSVLELFRVLALESNDIWGFLHFFREYSSRVHYVS